MANPSTKPKRPKSRYAQKRAGTITPGPAGDLRALLHGPRFLALMCSCGIRDGRFDPVWLCGRCARTAAVLSAPAARPYLHPSVEP